MRTGWKNRPQPKTIILLIKKTNRLIKKQKNSLSPPSLSTSHTSHRFQSPHNCTTLSHSLCLSISPSPEQSTDLDTQPTNLDTRPTDLDIVEVSKLLHLHKGVVQLLQGDLRSAGGPVDAVPRGRGVDGRAGIDGGGGLVWGLVRGVVHGEDPGLGHPSLDQRVHQLALLLLHLTVAQTEAYTDRDRGTQRIQRRGGVQRYAENKGGGGAEICREYGEVQRYAENKEGAEICRE